MGLIGQCAYDPISLLSYYFRGLQDITGLSGIQKNPIGLFILIARYKFSFHRWPGITGYLFTEDLFLDPQNICRVNLPGMY